MNSWAKRLGFRKPQNRIELAIWIGAGFILSAIIGSLLFVKKPQEYPPQSLIALYTVNILRDIGLGVIATSILVSGFHRLKFDDKKGKGYFVTITGVLLFILMIGRPTITSVLLSNIQSDSYKFSKLTIEKRTQTLANRDLSPIDKAEFRKAIAEEGYFHDGIITDYKDERGNKIIFQPTVEDLRRRESYLLMPRTIMILRIEMAIWIVVFIATIITSIIYYRKRHL